MADTDHEVTEYQPSAGRRRNMQAIRHRDTRPELAVRSILYAAGLRYRCDLRIKVSERAVRPDIVFTRRKVAVFIDGCFWHSCPAHGTRPKHNVEYWSPKLQRNFERDVVNTSVLQKAGWKVIRAWAHEEPIAIADRVRTAVLART